HPERRQRRHAPHHCVRERLPGHQRERAGGMTRSTRIVSMSPPMPSSMTALRGPTLALLSAALFGASTPLAKLLLGRGVDSWLLAGLLYLASGIGLGLVFLGTRAAGNRPVEAPLRATALPVLALVILFGGNLESLLTLVIAWTVFREHVDVRLLIGAGAILIGAALLSWPQGGARIGYGAVMVAAACLCWALDNNFTRKLSSADPVQIACLKGLVAGGINLGIARLGGAPMPHALTLSMVAVVGLLGYGASLVLFMLALRHLGTARTGAYYATAPFIGAVLAV